MLINKKDFHTTITVDDNCNGQFFLNLKNQINDFSNKHLIIDFSKLDSIKLDDVLQFFDIAQEKRKQNTSFIIVATGIDVDDIPDEINVVPTLNEALDILEMDAIERDLMGL
ncbi:MAG: ribonuclease Z [Urechidicola sp.]|nr:ribonuclease Z [Urechidicola sp.]